MKTLGVLVGNRVPPEFSSILLEMRRWCYPRFSLPNDPEPAAWIASGPEIEGLDDLLSERRPVAVWVSDLDELNVVSNASVTLTDRSDMSSKGPVIIAGFIDTTKIPYFPPFVRRRWRQRLGFPEVWPAVIDGSTVPPQLVPTALALCSAAVVTGDGLLHALAMGAPAVTDPQSALAVGARDGVQLSVAESEDFAARSKQLSADDAVGARLSRLGRRLIERRFDPTRVLGPVARRLGLVRDPAFPEEVLAGRLEELGTPQSSFVTRRAALALHP